MNLFLKITLTTDFFTFGIKEEKIVFVQVNPKGILNGYWIIRLHPALCWQLHLKPTEGKKCYRRVAFHSLNSSFIHYKQGTPNKVYRITESILVSLLTLFFYYWWRISYSTDKANGIENSSVNHTEMSDHVLYFPIYFRPCTTKGKGLLMAWHFPTE